jgi:hypothetical protein
MGDLAVEERLRDHADDLTVVLQHPIGEHAHQPDPCAAIDQAEPTARERPSQVHGRLAKGGLIAHARSAEYPDAGHDIILVLAPYN